MHPRNNFLFKVAHLLDIDIFHIENSRHLNPANLYQVQYSMLMWTSDVLQSNKSSHTFREAEQCGIQLPNRNHKVLHIYIHVLTA